MIELRELSKFYGSTRAVDARTFDVRQGVVAGVLALRRQNKSSLHETPLRPVNGSKLSQMMASARTWTVLVVCGAPGFDKSRPRVFRRHRSELPPMPRTSNRRAAGRPASPLIRELRSAVD